MKEEKPIPQIPIANPEVSMARVQLQEQRFMQGCSIPGDDLIALCLFYDVDVSEDTLSLIQNYIVDVSMNGNLRFVRPKGLPKLRLDPVHQLAVDVYNAINIQNSIDNIINK